MGYNENGYRVLLENKILNARHVDVIETGMKLICLDEEKNENLENISNYQNGSENSVDDEIKDKEKINCENQEENE